MGRGTPGGVFAIVAGWFVACLLWSQHTAPAGYLASFDDVFRLVHAHEASNGALAPSDVWPPLQFWIFGAALRVWPDATGAPRVLNVLASAGTLLALERLANAMGLGLRGRIAAVVALGAFPTFWWIAPSALVEPMALCAGMVALLGVFRWWVDDRREGLVLAFGALTVAGMLRYEAWVWLGLLGGACVVAPRFGREAARGPARRWLPLLAGALVFPVGWCGVQVVAHGDPLHFATFAHSFFIEDEVDGGVGGRLANAVAGIADVVGPTALASVLGLAASGRLRGRWLVFGLPVAIAAIQAVAHVAGYAGLHNLWRHYLVLAPPLAIGVGVLVDRVASRAGRFFGWVLLAIVLQPLVRTGESPPAGYEQHLGDIATRMRALHDELGGTVLVEGVGYDSRVLQILLGDMDAAVFDRLIWLVPLDRPMTAAERASNRSRLSGSYGEVGAWLDDAGVRVLVVRTPAALQMARAQASVVFHLPDPPPVMGQEAVDPAENGEGWYVLRRDGR